MVNMQFTTSASCRSNTAYTIGGVNWAAKRRIQRKALHKCRDMKKTGADMELYNCLTRELWSEEKTTWCCENYNQGCPSPNK